KSRSQFSELLLMDYFAFVIEYRVAKEQKILPVTNPITRPLQPHLEHRLFMTQSTNTPQAGSFCKWQLA
ncbi:MAG: hypothetical protein AB2735_01190, partial [Candidatus Thiodiazotropha taylori]